MLNRFAKFLLVSTSLAPILGAVAVNQFARDEPWCHWIGWLGATLLLVLLCWLMLRYAGKNLPVELLDVVEFDRKSEEMLAFLLTYMLPFIATDNMAFQGDWLTGAYILSVIFLVVSHAGALHFNPAMWLLGYHFYAAKSSAGVSTLLISDVELRRAEQNLKTVRLANGIHLYRGGESA